MDFCWTECTRQTNECAFGWLTEKVGIFQKALETNVEVTKCTIKSACVVNNYIKKKKKTTETNWREEEILEQEHQNVTTLVEHTICFGCPSTEALPVPEKLKDYFVSILWRQKTPVTPV